jgi:hypothetical protein
MENKGMGVTKVQKSLGSQGVNLLHVVRTDGAQVIQGEKSMNKVVFTNKIVLPTNPSGSPVNGSIWLYEEA